MFGYLTPSPFEESTQHFTSGNCNTTPPHIMDIGHFYSPSTELHRTRSQQQTSDEPKFITKTTTKAKAGIKSGDTAKAMVDNKGWRKKIGGKPKELPPINTGSDDTAAAPLTEVAVDSTDRRRHGWRKTIAGSRPVTPMAPAPPTPTPEDVEDTRSERSKASTPRRDSKPKLNRYTALFTSHKEEPASLIFSEPWSADVLPTREDPWSHVDPIVIMESIHSHMCKNYMVPIPLQYNSGLFQIFDDYRKLRLHKELPEAREREALEHSRKVTAQWLKSEELYGSEIRRLELLIARGTTGMTG